MAVEVKLGILRHRILVDGARVPVRREGGGWYAIGGPSRSSRVMYSPFSDRLRIETPEGPLEVRFRWRRTTFVWRGRTYRVRSILWGDVRIEEGGRIVLHGKTTWSGVRFNRVAPELEPVVHELALGFAFRVLWFWFAFGAGA